MMRFAYANRFDIPKGIEVLKNHIKWLKENDAYSLRPGSLELLKKGVIYLAGRDKKYRPIIVMNLYRVDLDKTDMQDFIGAIASLCMIVRDHCFVPYFVENWIIIIEVNGLSLWSFPFKLVKEVLNVTGANFQSTLEKLYLMHPSFIISGAWKVIRGWLDPETANKI
mmetsp:Transcript_7108/g.6372  ORF Transcript_7108/g.6372 Transcript_7108/m.6372 type:complete len:167 (-) Transcript_7108:741-1241(-)